jgi:hypothetical protein
LTAADRQGSIQTMKKPKLIQKDPVKVYEVEVEPFDWQEFIDWLADLKDDKVSISVNGRMIPFNNQLERLYFVLGFDFAWDEFTKKRS